MLSSFKDEPREEMKQLEGAFDLGGRAQRRRLESLPLWGLHCERRVEMAQSPAAAATPLHPSLAPPPPGVEAPNPNPSRIHG